MLSLELFIEIVLYEIQYFCITLSLYRIMLDVMIRHLIWYLTGSSHIDTLHTLNNLCALYTEQGGGDSKLEEATSMI